MACGAPGKQGLPAGPAGIPVLGAALKWKGPETNLEWTKEFGPIYSVRIGPNQMVYINSIHLVEQYMEQQQGAALLGRPEGPAAIANGLLFGQGEAWQKNRAAFGRALHSAQLLETYESVILTEADRVVDELQSTLGSPVEVDTVLLPAMVRRLVTLLLGQPLVEETKGKENGAEERTKKQKNEAVNGSSNGDAEEAGEGEEGEMARLVRVMQDLEEVDLTSKSTQMFLKLHTFRRPLQKMARRTIPDMFRMSKVMQGVLKAWIDRRRSAIAANGGQPDPRALLDVVLTSPEYQKSGSPCAYDKELMQSVMDLFNGGVTSTLSALEFTLLYLIHHPHVQQKVKDEIDKVTAAGVTLSWVNRDHFPYTQATLIEGLRLASVTPSSLPHVCTEDVLIDQYEIPQNVMVMASIYSLHRDPEFYRDPELFRPERHLSPQGTVVRPRSYRPFGIGERMCLGYQQAEIELFLILTRLVSAYRIRAEDPANPPPFESNMRVVRRLKPFACVLEPWDT